MVVCVYNARLPVTVELLAMSYHSIYIAFSVAALKCAPTDYMDNTLLSFKSCS